MAFILGTMSRFLFCYFGRDVVMMLHYRSCILLASLSLLVHSAGAVLVIEDIMYFWFDSILFSIE